MDKEEKDGEAQALTKTKAKFEDLFEYIGGLGRSQWLLYFSTAVFESTCFISMYYFIFEMANPGFSCVDTRTTDEGNVSYGNFTRSCPKSPNSCSNLTFNPKYTSIKTEWHLICDQAYLTRIIASVFFVGVLVGALLAGWLGDIFGRKKVLLIFWTGNMLSQAALSLTTMWEIYVCVRICVGIFAGGAAVVASVLPMEYISSKYRTLVAQRVGWQLGGFILAMLAYLLRSWRFLCVGIGFFWIILLPVFIICLPESARWLIGKGRIKEAKVWIDRIAKCNGREAFDSLTLLEEIAEEERAKRDLAQHYSYLDLFRTRKYTVRTLALMFGWFSTSLITYGVTSNLTTLTGDLYLKVTIFAAVKLSTRWTVIFVANLIGRRKSILLYMSIPIFCMFTIMVLDLTKNNEHFDKAKTALALISYSGLDGAWGIQFMFSTEAFPTVVRSISSGVGNMAARIGGIIAPQIGLLSRFHVSIPYVVFGCFALAETIIMFVVMPETNGKPLVESLPPRGGKGKQKDIEMTKKEENGDA